MVNHLSSVVNIFINYIELLSFDHLHAEKNESYIFEKVVVFGGDRVPLLHHWI